MAVGSCYYHDSYNLCYHDDARDPQQWQVIEMALLHYLWLNLFW